MGSTVTDYEAYRANEMDKHAAMLDHWLREDLGNRGENRLGIEFKHDQQFRHTGNLYIEVAEKARPRDGDYAPAGVYRSDNTRLWVQGDRDMVWVFPKSLLRAVVESGHYDQVELATSRGCLLPTTVADTLALWTIECGEEPRPVPGPYRFRCICRFPDLTSDGRCARCWGNPDQDDPMTWVGWHNPDPLARGPS